jgi:hypothetical protein
MSEPEITVYQMAEEDLIMKNAIVRKLSLFLSVALCIGVIWGGNAMAAVADEETEAATESHLLRIMLPANTQRVLPQSVPAEVTQTLDKITAAGNGKFRQGESEVLIWAGSNYKKANSSTIINRLTGNMKTAGWQYTPQGEENGVTLFMAVKEGNPRRAIVGFHGATDEVLIFAAMEIFPNGSGSVQNTDQSDSQSASQVSSATTDIKSGRGAEANEILGKWYTGNVSMMNEKNLYTGQITSSNGSLQSYKFLPGGRFEVIGYMKSTMYGCTTDLFNDKRGSYEVSGNQITLKPTKNYWKNTYSCSPSSNKERDYVLDIETFTFRVETNKYGKEQICLTNAMGDSCLERTKE